MFLFYNFEGIKQQKQNVLEPRHQNKRKALPARP